MTITDDRYCTIEESIIESCKEVVLMRKGILPKRSMEDLFLEIQEWDEEDE